MSRNVRTKEERFLINLFNLAKAKGSFDTPIDRFEVGHATNLHTRVVNSICNQLMQTNFIKKNGPEPDKIYLTPNGLRLIETLLGS